MFATAFQEKITTLQQLVLLNGGCTDGDTLKELERSIVALENQVTAARRSINEDHAFIARAEKLLEALDKQQQDADVLKNHLPDSILSAEKQKQEAEQVLADKTNTVESRGTAVVAAKSEKRKSKGMPPELAHITSKQFSQLDKHVIGRITQEKINSFIDDLNALFKSKYTLVLCKRSLVKEEDLAKKNMIQDNEIVALDKIKSFYLSVEDGKCLGLKQDATTRTLLVILRKLQWLRLHSNHGHTAYVIP